MAANVGITAIMQAVQNLLQQALGANATVVLGIPRSMPSSLVAYTYHDGYTDPSQRSPGKMLVGGYFRRQHVIPIHLLLASGADQQTELTLYGLSDSIADTFYQNHRLGFDDQTIGTTTLYQRDGKQQAGTAFVVDNGIEYRHRWWTLEVEEIKAVAFA